MYIQICDIVGWSVASLSDYDPKAPFHMLRIIPITMSLCFYGYMSFTSVAYRNTGLLAAYFT